MKINIPYISEKDLKASRKYFDELYKELKHEDNPIVRKNLFKEMIKCNNVMIIHLLNYSSEMIVFHTKEDVKSQFGCNNSFFDYIDDKIEYELDKVDLDCLKYAFNSFILNLLEGFRFFFSVCHRINQKLERIEYKYLYK